MRKQFQIVLLALLTCAAWGCSTDFEVYAPEKEIRSVYCVLNARDSVQYVRVAKAFQYKGDAIEYAGANDFSVHGLSVKLKGNGKTWTATEVPNFPKEPGTFLPMHTVYSFRTDGTFQHDSLAYDKEYTLEIGTPDAADFVTGKTYVSAVPKIKGELNYVSLGSSVCLPKLFLDRKFEMVWKVLGPDQDEINYEIRIGMAFQKNGMQDTVTFGPTRLFTGEPKCNQAECVYSFEAKQLLGVFSTKMPVLPATLYTYDVRDSCALLSQVNRLPTSLWFEVTAVDKFLSTYMNVNDPAVIDLNGSKPEYTNLTGNIEAIGIFGSYMTDKRYAILQPCGEYLLGLNGTPQPVGCEW